MLPHVMVHDPAPPWVIWNTVFCLSAGLLGFPMVRLAAMVHAEVVAEGGVHGHRRRVGKGDDGGRSLPSPSLSKELTSRVALLLGLS